MNEKDANLMQPGKAYVPMCQGGEGSGNFGHEGRPGEVGGSGPGGGSFPKSEKSDRVSIPQKIYHGTANAEVSISEYRGKGQYGQSQTLAGTGVYFTSDPELAQVYADRSKERRGEYSTGSPKVIGVEIDPESAVIYDYDKPADINEVRDLTSSWADWGEVDSSDDIDVDDPESRTSRADKIVSDAFERSLDPDWVGSESGKAGTLGYALEQVRVDLLDANLMATEDAAGDLSNRLSERGYNVVHYVTGFKKGDPYAATEKNTENWVVLDKSALKPTEEIKNLKWRSK